MLVAVALIPLTVLRFVDVFKDDVPGGLKLIPAVPAIAEGFLCFVCWAQLKHWFHWREQRRTLFKAWLVFMAAPFAVFLIPMDPIVEGVARDLGGGPQAMIALKAAIAVMALLTLAPKAVSLLAGTIRAGIVTKMLFPGTSGPGWMIVFAAPIYTLFVFTLLIVPYQLTGSGWYLASMLALAAGQYALGRAGLALTKPTTHDDAVAQVGKARSSYLIAMAVFALCFLIALGTMAKQLGIESILSTVLSFQANVLILTLIGSDLVITNLERARSVTADTQHHEDESNKRLSAFVGGA